MKIALIGYRQWALDIYEKIANSYDYEFIRINSKEEFSLDLIEDFKPDYILFYGWSWIINKNLIEKFKCVMLHPSPLPKYRGGSPIQNQIINGETHSAVTIFLMNEGIDTGPIIKQEPLSLEGTLEEIFARITEIGVRLTNFLLDGDFDYQDQDDSQATYYARRKEEESEITIDEIQEKDSTYLFNKIRMLQDPYPKPFIRTADGKKLYIEKAKIGE